MKKNCLSILSLVALLSGCSFQLPTIPVGTDSSSITSNTPTSSSTHTHTYSEDWSKDEEGHWHDSTCDHEATAKEEHTWNEGETTKYATCTENGEITYTCTVCSYTKVEDYDLLGHSYGEATYTWSEDNSTVTAKRVCSTDESHVEEETVETVAEITQIQTCTDDELTTYTATFTNEAFETQVKENVLTNGALSHSYDTVTYTWSEDNSTVTAKRVCSNDESHVEEETAYTISEVTQVETCTDDELTKYTATFNNDGFETQVKENVVTKVAKGHIYEEGVCSCGAEDPDYVAPVVAKHVDFNTIQLPASKQNGDSSYTGSYTTASGWVTVNSAIQCGGANDMNPQFKVIGPDNTYKAVCMNGKVSAPGSITSPTLSGGLSKITIDYTKMFTDTKIGATITVTDLSNNNVYTHDFTVTLDKNDKYNVYTDEWTLDTPISGDFTIVVKNSCPTSNTGNKDRITILDIEWQ